MLSDDHKFFSSSFPLLAKFSHTLLHRATFAVFVEFAEFEIFPKITRWVWPKGRTFEGHTRETGLKQVRPESPVPCAV